MTQEELDALMSEDVNIDDIAEDLEETQETETAEGSSSETADSENKEDDSSHYRVSADGAWPPPPPTDDHKMVHQLDDVTRDSEVKATQIFDKLENLSNGMMDIEGKGNDLKTLLDSQKELIEKLHEAFPKIEAFGTARNNLESADEQLQEIIDISLSMGDEIMMAMDIMQYQDIHRQKIERVINVMRALSKYMSSLFEGKVDDSKRVSSATHIDGDTTTEEVVSDDDIEALINSLGAKG